MGIKGADKDIFHLAAMTIQGTGKRQLEKQDESWLSNLNYH